MTNGAVTCRVRLDRGGYVPGEAISIWATITNSSRVTIKHTRASLTEVCFPLLFFLQNLVFFRHFGYYCDPCIFGVFLPFGWPSLIILYLAVVTIKHTAGLYLPPIFFTSLITSAHYWYHHEADLFFLTFTCFVTWSRVTLWWKTKDLIFNHISYIYLCHFPVWCRKLSLEICHLWRKVEFFADSLLGYSTIKSNNFSLLKLFFVTIYNKMLPSQFTRKSTVRNSTLITRECVVIYGF